MLCFDAALAFVAPTTGHANIAVALASFLIAHCYRVAMAPSLAVELPLRCPLPSRSTTKLPLRCPLSSIPVALTAHCPCARAVPRHPSPSSHHQAIPHRPLLSRRQLPSIAVHRPSPLSHLCIVHCCPYHAIYRCRIAVASSTIHRRPASITNVLSIAAVLSIAVKWTIAVAPSIAVSYPAGCCVASRHANASSPPVQEFSYGSMFNLFLMQHYSMTCWEATCIVEMDLNNKLRCNMDRTHGAQCVVR